MADLNALMVGAPVSGPPLNSLLSMDDITAAGRSVRRPTQPTVGALPPPSSGERFAGWLQSIGLPRTTAERIGDLVPFTPPGGAYDAGQTIGQGIEEGSAGTVGLGALATLASLPLTIAPRPRPRIGSPIRAYHGSPHQFDEFDISRIGTGEGAQAYGHGLYFAEAEPVARSYRNALSPAPFPDGDPANGAWHILGRYGDAEGEAFFRRHYASGMSPEALEDALTRARSASSGHMYEVALHARPEQFLDWDRLPREQTGEVRAALRPLYEDNVRAVGASQDLMRVVYGPGLARLGMRDPFPSNTATIGYYPRTQPPSDLADWAISHDPRSASTLYYGIGEIAGGGNGRALQQRATQSLLRAGIPGIRYLDQGSRAVGAGTRNYVVFDPNIIEVLRRYGIFGPLAGGASAATLMGDPPNALMQ